MIKNYLRDFVYYITIENALVTLSFREHVLMQLKGISDGGIYIGEL